MAYIDPTTVRLSDHFLLSDFMGCHSVYTKGYKNLFIDPSGEKIAEATKLCEEILEPLLAAYGPMSIGYGYISPALSKAIVTYQDPNMPSYHRWDKGAAADICIHSQVRQRAPIEIAHEIDEGYAYSRMITYSESPYICVATQINEGDTPRKAFYENRYCGKKGAKPMYIKKSATQSGRRAQAKGLSLEHDWKGAGYPTYHGGGIRQFQHIPVSKYSVASDFLYSTHAIREGIANAADMRRYGEVFHAAGNAYDALLKRLDVPRISIVRAFESFRFNDYPQYSWNTNFALDLIPPSYISKDALADVALDMLGEYFSSVSADKRTGIVSVTEAYDHVS